MTKTDQQAFEAWAAREGLDLTLTTDGIGLDKYQSQSTQAAAAAWRARDAQLAAVTQQRDELVEAVARWRNQKRRDGARFGPSDSTLDLAFIHFQSTQPQGEWIEIKPDGSNLPPDIEDAEWTIEQRTHDGGRFCGASLTTKEIPSLWRIKPCPREYHVIACWSIPHIDRRPDIPDYQPKEQRDE